MNSNATRLLELRSAVQRYPHRLLPETSWRCGISRSPQRPENGFTRWGFDMITGSPKTTRRLSPHPWFEVIEFF
jgi:hypothetical protein